MILDLGGALTKSGLVLRQFQCDALRIVRRAVGALRDWIEVDRHVGSRIEVDVHIVHVGEVEGLRIAAVLEAQIVEVRVAISLVAAAEVHFRGLRALIP